MSQHFAMELARYGPARPYAPPSRQRAESYCRRLAQNHYENFSVASLLLPRRLLRHFHAVYAYCRWADDLADETAGGSQALALLAWWREELLRCYDRQPRHPVMVALRDTIDRFRIPPEPFLDLLRAFEQDQCVKRYQSYQQLLDYCRNSANPVGRLVLYLCEACTTDSAALSDRICTGLQLANFWQDVARDLDIGRVYLPAEDRARFGYADADLESAPLHPAIRRLAALRGGASPHAVRARPAPGEAGAGGGAADIALFARGGLAILAKIEEQAYDVWRRRPVLSKWDKGRLLLGAPLGANLPFIETRTAGRVRMIFSEILRMEI